MMGIKLDELMADNHASQAHQHDPGQWRKSHKYGRWGTDKGMNYKAQASIQTIDAIRPVIFSRR